MKTKYLLLTFAAAALLFGCTKPASETPLPEEAAYHGKLSVIEIGDTLYEQENVKVSYDLDDRTVDISLYDVSFSSKMPVKLAVVVLEDIPFTKQGNRISLRIADLIPMMEVRGERVPYERYRCTDLTGEITPEKMVLYMKLGGYQTDYTGVFTTVE